MDKQAKWIWYPGDFEIWLGNRFNNRRTERGAIFPPFWKQDAHWPTVEFSTVVELSEPERIHIAAEGKYNFMLDGKLQFGQPDTFLIPAGQHRLHFKVHNTSTPPALFVKGKTICTGEAWLATYEDKIWIDENGEAHGAGIYVPAGVWQFCDKESLPSQYRLPRREMRPVSKESVTHNETLYDFGRETFGYLKLQGLKGEGLLGVYYGESREEALDKMHCETLDRCMVIHDTDPQTSVLTPDIESKAFRYVLIEREGTTDYEELLMDEEYAPYDETRSGTFRCDDDTLNTIWQVAAYTMDLTTREFFVDGIKRDRWTWSGDAIQSYLMNYYLRFDCDCVRRTIRQLRGKDPVTAHVNTIMDYTFYWFKSVHDFYLYTGDLDFVREIYPRMRSLMAYCLGRTNANGMMEGQADDWIFVDWVDFPMHKRGTLCFEQLLFTKSLQTMALCAELLRDHPMDNAPQGSLTTSEYASDAERFTRLANDLHGEVQRVFWDEKRCAYFHAIEDGEINNMVTRFPNMFAIVYGLADSRQQQAILKQVLLNDQVERITTPYMRFYELEALCMMHQQDKVLNEIKAYWGGMLREGATTFWEKYVPEEQGTQHLAMYGRPYGKSLCHAWGASPIYLLGRYFLGVSPTKAGYEEYEVCPILGGLKWMEGSVPTPFGLITVKVDEHTVSVRSDGGKGTLIIGQKRIPIPAGKIVTVRRT